MNINKFVERCIRDLDLVTEQRNAAVRIDSSLLSQTENIIKGSIRFRKR